MTDAERQPAARSARAKDKDKTYYAKSSRGGRHLQGARTISATALDKSVDDFRNKKLFDFAWSDPTKVQIGSGGYAIRKAATSGPRAAKTMDSTSCRT